MIQQKIISKTIGAEPLIVTDRGRCVRMRFSRSACSACTADCRAGAIALDGGIAIDRGKCTECMLCVSGCPAGCFIGAGDDFFALQNSLRRAEGSVAHPVLGCKRAGDTEAHAKTNCLGVLSEEHLIALAGSLAKPLYLNVSACGRCRNSFIVETLRARVQSVQAKTGPDVAQKIVFAERTEDLPFKDVPVDRRGFFQALKTMTFAQVAGLLDDKDAEQPASYTVKRIPAKRDILNTVVRRLGDGSAVMSILHNYGFTVKAGPSCTNCFACVGMCPTGALKTGKNAEGRTLLFNSSLCAGCGLCRDFCPEGAASVSPGFFGDNFFEHGICNTGSPAVFGAAGQN